MSDLVSSLLWHRSRDASVYHSGTGTIEFRQPPHVNNFTEAEDWVQTALYLCHRGLN
jgi:hypothetical protein